MQAVINEQTPIRDTVMGHGIGRLVFHDYLGKDHQLTPGPQAYLVDHLDAESQIYPHFHDIDQFQVFVGGTGKLGRHLVPPVTVHYADGFTPYGPIVANGFGLSYFTLRLASATGGWRMPGNRDRIPGGKPGRTFSATFHDYAQVPTRQGEVLRQTLWGPADDGLEALALKLGPNTLAVGDAPAGGQYVVVCHGTLRHEGQILTPNSLLLLERGEAAPHLLAGAQGASVLVLQYPQQSERPGSNPDLPKDFAASYDMPTA